MNSDHSVFIAKAARIVAIVALVAVSSVTGSGVAQAAYCETWQYKFTGKSGIYHNMGLDSKFAYAYKGWYMNSSATFGTSENGRMAYGQVYYSNKERAYRYVYVNKSNLDYVTCW